MIERICEHCLGTGKATSPTPLEATREEINKRGYKIAFPELISDKDVADLLDYADVDSFRRSKTRAQLGNPIKRGKNCFYSIEKIALYSYGYR